MKTLILTLFILFTAANAQAADNVIRDFTYGTRNLQKMDIYLPKTTQQAPVIFMVHGGGWKHGDKRMKRVVENKVARWVPAGFIFISVNYPMLPEAGVEEQVLNIAKALATAQKNARQWGGDPDKFILMGHSAGGHLISLINANPEIAYREGAVEWLGAVSLDAAALDLVKIMKAPHWNLYDEPFGGMNQTQLKELSPYHVLMAKSPPWFGVCSARRDTSCTQSQEFIAKATNMKLHAEYITEDLSHAEINEYLGLAGPYTQAVEKFMASLDKETASRLTGMGDTTEKPDRRRTGPLRLMLQKRENSRFNH